MHRPAIGGGNTAQEDKGWGSEYLFQIIPIEYRYPTLIFSAEIYSKKRDPVSNFFCLISSMRRSLAFSNSRT